MTTFMSVIPNIGGALGARFTKVMGALFLTAVLAACQTTSDPGLTTSGTSTDAAENQVVQYADLNEDYAVKPGFINGKKENGKDVLIAVDGYFGVDDHGNYDEGYGRLVTQQVRHFVKNELHEAGIGKVTDFHKNSLSITAANVLKSLGRTHEITLEVPTHYISGGFSIELFGGAGGEAGYDTVSVGHTQYGFRVCITAGFNEISGVELSSAQECITVETKDTSLGFLNITDAIVFAKLGVTDQESVLNAVSKLVHASMVKLKTEATMVKRDLVS